MCIKRFSYEVCLVYKVCLRLWWYRITTFSDAIGLLFKLFDLANIRIMNCIPIITLGRVALITLTLVSIIGCVAISPPKPELAPKSDTVPASSVFVKPSPSLSVVDGQLLRAEALFSQGKLLFPEDDNAYIRYRAVQIFEPDNIDAKSGLDAILVNQINLGREALERSRLSVAKTHLKQLRSLFPSNSMLDQFERDIQQTRKALRVKTSKKALTPVRDDRVYLDERAIKEESPQLIEQLHAIAETLVLTQESVLIFARSDRSGRWIYKQMRDAVPDYRIRGDIRIGRPAIKKLPPLDER